MKVAVHLTDPRVHGLTFVQDYPTQRTADGAWIASIGDLYGTVGRALGLVFHVENVTDLGRTQLGEVKVSADLITAQGVEHERALPVVPNLDAQDHVEPEVKRTLVRFEAAKGRTPNVREEVETSRRKRGAWGRATTWRGRTASTTWPEASVPET